MKKLVIIAFLLLPALAHAQVQAVPTQQSTAAEGSHVFSGTQMSSITVSWNAATTARYLIIFDATTLPSNGATTACTASAGAPANPCWTFCQYLNTSGTAPSSQSFGQAPALLARNGAFVAAVSTGAGCGTLTVDGSNDWFVGQVQ